MGKTRLALAMAERQLVGADQTTYPPVGTRAPLAPEPTQGPFANGLFFVPLGRISDPEQIVPSAAEARRNIRLPLYSVSSRHTRRA